MTQNPFPGPQPYRASDRRRFYGREEVSYKLEGFILANRCVTVFGPSGAGKSSLVQASVIPGLIESQEIRVVRVDSWPEGQEPVRWLASTMYGDLNLGAPPGGAAMEEAILAAAQRSARRSPRLVLLYLDQMEQLLYAGRTAAEREPLFECLNRLADTPLRNLRLVLSLREDYLGRFRDRLSDRRRLLDHGFRVGPLTVAELCDAVCQAAAAGEPPQAWEPEPMRALMLQVRVPGQAESDEAEAQAAYAQIVCRALFQERAQGGDAAREASVEAEPILRRYFEATLHDLGPLRDAAERLLEEHLITADGSRTVRTEKELSRLLPPHDLSMMLRALETAAILHAEEHQGSRYFEIGHDWLAKKVYEERQVREQAEQKKQRDEEQRRQLEQQRADADARMAKERAQRRRMTRIAVTSLVFAGVTTALSSLAWHRKQAAEAANEAALKAQRLAEERQIEAHDARIMAGFRELSFRGELAMGIKLLPEVHRPADQRSWIELATDALNTSALRVTLSGHTGPLAAAAFSPDGKRVLTASEDRTARLWNADGSGPPVVLTGHEGPLVFASWSPDGTRVVTVSQDAAGRVWTGRVWSVDPPRQLGMLKGHDGTLLFASWSPDGKRLVTASTDRTAQIWHVDRPENPVVLRGHEGAVTCAVFLPDGAHVLTASEDKTVRLWNSDGAGRPVSFPGGHDDWVISLAVSPDGTRVVSASRDRTARIWDVNGKGPPIVLKGHEGGVYHAAWSPDGAFVATASADHTARVWRADGKEDGPGPVVLKGHELSVGFVSWSPDGKYVATASSDRTARLWPADGSGAPLVLSGHRAPVRSVTWSPDGATVLTATEDRSGRSLDTTAKIWSREPLTSIARGRHGSGFFHAAFVGADGRHVVSAYDDKTARLWDLDGAEPPVAFLGHAAWVASAALSPDGTRVVTASFDKTACVWSKDGKKQATLLGHTAEVRLASFSPDGRRIVTASEDRTARVWSADGKEQAILRGHEDWLSSAAWSPDGTRIVTTSWDRTARIWNADGSGTPVVLSGHGGLVSHAAWSPDGQRVITISDDRTARIWSADGSGKPIVLGRHPSAVLRAAWSPDGKRVAISSFDGTVHLWNADGAGEPIVLSAPAPVIAMAFSGGGQTLLTVTADNTAHAWMLDVEALKRRLRTANADCVSPQDRVIYLGEPSSTARTRYAACERSFGRAPLTGVGP